MKSALVLGSLVALAGCDDLLSSRITFGDDASATVELDIDIAGECTGGWTTTDEHGVTTGTKTLLADGTVCRIDVTWDGDLISLAKMRTDTVAECGADKDKCDPDELDLALTIRLEDAFFDAGAEHMTREQLIAMSSRATTNGAELFSLDKSTPLPVELGPSDAVKAELKRAYLVSGSLPVHADGSIELSMVDVRRLQEVGGPIGTLTVGFTSHLSGAIDGHL